MRPKEEIGMKGPQGRLKARYGTAWVLHQIVTLALLKRLEKRPYRSIRFGATKVEWLVCKKMVDLRENGYTYGGIAKYLNDAGIKTKANRPWNYYIARFVTLRAKEEIENGRND